MAEQNDGTLAIVLTGGGARAAYQVGFLRWMARNIPDMNIPILTGVSAGAINAAYLASFGARRRKRSSDCGTFGEA